MTSWQHTENTSRALAPVIRGKVDRPIPEGVHIERGEMRTNAAMRERYERHLNALMAEERLSHEEHAARAAAAARAVTEADLQLLLEDLPPLPVTRDEEHEIARRNREPLLLRLRAVLPWRRMRGLRMATYIAGICGSIAGGIIASDLITIRPAGVPLEGGTIGSLIAIGALTIFGFVWSIILMATDPMWKKHDLNDQWKRDWSS